MSVSAAEAKMRSGLFSCAAVYNEKRAFLNLESNDTFEIALVTAGAGIHRVLDKDIPCKEGDIFIIPAGVPHGYFIEKSFDLLNLRRLHFNLRDMLGAEIANKSSNRYCYGAFRESRALGYAALNANTAEKIQNIWDLIEQELERGEESWRDAVSNMLSYLMITVARYINSSVKNLTFASYGEWDMVSSAIKILREDFGNPELNQEKIARRLYVSKSHFGRIFKKLTGEFFSDYLRDLRIKNVCRLLEKSEGNVDEVAKECGFRNMPAFYRNFSAARNMTPGEYRKSIISSKKGTEDYIKLLKREKIMGILNDISENIQKGKSKIVKELVQQALDEGVNAADILKEGLLEGMGIIGEKFKNNEVYVPQVLVSARAMSMGTEILKPYLVENGVVATGKVCIGTVRGDLHDIGKNLVKMMMEGKGLEVVDLGTDVAPETFVKTAIEQNCQVICCSALLTTTMPVMAEVVAAAEAAGVRDKVKIMIGGAPVSQEYCDKIGADGYSIDAASAADAAVEFCKG